MEAPRAPAAGGRRSLKRMVRTAHASCILKKQAKKKPTAVWGDSIMVVEAGVGPPRRWYVLAGCFLLVLSSIARSSQATYVQGSAGDPHGLRRAVVRPTAACQLWVCNGVRASAAPGWCPCRVRDGASARACTVVYNALVHYVTWARALRLEFVAAVVVAVMQVRLPSQQLTACWSVCAWSPHLQPSVPCAQPY